MFLELLRATHGGFLRQAREACEMPDTPVVVHGVQHIFHPTARLERWPDDDHRTRLVFITRDLPQRTVREFFECARWPDRDRWTTIRSFRLSRHDRRSCGSG